jgi:hypothetical protein
MRRVPVIDLWSVRIAHVQEVTVRHLLRLAVGVFLLSSFSSLAPALEGTGNNGSTATATSTGTLTTDDGLAGRRRSASYETGSYNTATKSSVSASPEPAPPPAPKPPPVPPGPPAPTPGVATVPEASSLALLSVGLLGIVVAVRKLNV